MSICTGNRQKCTDLVHFWSHTQIEEKTVGSGIMMRMLPIWYNFKVCKIVSRTHKLTPDLLVIIQSQYISVDGMIG